MTLCKAHSTRTGLPCRAHAIRGGTVCVVHGGAAPQVKAKAREMILGLRDKAGAVLDKQLDRGEVPPAVTMATVRDYTKTLAEIDQHEAAAESGSVIEEWLKFMRSAE